MTRPLTLRERGFRLPEDRSPVSLLRAVRDFAAPDRAHHPIEGPRALDLEDDPRSKPVIVTLESEAAIINALALHSGYIPVGIYAKLARRNGTSWPLRASYALRHTDTSPDGRKGIAAWFGYPEDQIWPEPIVRPGSAARRIDPMGTLAAAGFVLPAEPPLVGFAGADESLGWRKWNLVRALAEFLFPGEVDAQFYARRFEWLPRVCDQHARPTEMRSAINGLTQTSTQRETIAHWLGFPVETIWPDHLARKDGKLPAAPRRVRASEKALPR